MKTIRILVLGVAALLAAVLPGALLASSTSMVSGLDILRTWNLVVLGDLNSTSEVEGKTWVSGDLTGSSSNYQISSSVDSSDGVPGLTVVGDVTGSTKNLNNGSGAVVGGNVESGFNLNGSTQTVLVGGTISNTNVNSNVVESGLSATDPAYIQNLTQQASLIETSTQGLTYSLSQMEATSTVSITGTSATFTAVANSDGVAVFNIDAATLDGITEISFNTNGADTVIVNVSGTSITLDQNFLGNASGLGESVIWNFYEATDLTVKTGWYGSILAPYAAATTYNFIEGSAVFASLNQYGEMHVGTYSGSWDPAPTDTTSSSTTSSSGGTAVPEPGMVGLFALGLAALVLLRRRRARVA
ncbi:choice-of-anchor A family protein [Novosphingobium sp. 1949]|uniref:Choice-of-anchor A family protein n=1 Tax=Novosphingobium organovorum TaxID=2930092 RepID=A0ABT0BIQ4_9SPHN|nr:choice-of-anchor A family protein [Novosphingobium organovorum]MCJ2184945.1 choice-of-anchor A family protein [Novosphingobium organovorum]